MYTIGRIVVVFTLVVTFGVQTSATQFVVFPRTSELASPDGRFEVRNTEAGGSPLEFVGTFHSLWLVELSNGRSRKLCDYLGLAAIAWAGNDSLVVTQYVGKKTSRALVFYVTQPDDPVMLDKPTLVRMVPVGLRPTLRENDHVFVEASRVEDNTLYLRVWGYGQHDATGFRWRCEYGLREGTVLCAAEGNSP